MRRFAFIILSFHLLGLQLCSQELFDFSKVDPTDNIIKATQKALHNSKADAFNLKGQLFIELVDRGNYPEADSVYLTLENDIEIDNPNEFHRTVIAQKAYLDKVNTRYQSSLTQYLDLLNYYQAVGNLKKEFITHVHLSEYYRAKFEFESMYKRLQSALSISKRIDIGPDKMAFWHSRKASYHTQVTPQSDSGHYHLNEGLKLLEISGSNYVEGLILNEMAYSSRDNDFEKANELYKRSMNLFSEASLFRNYIDVSNNYGMLYLANNRLEESKAILEHVLEFGEENRLYSALEYTYNRLVSVANGLNDNELFLRYNERRVNAAYENRRQAFFIQADELSANFEKDLAENQLTLEKDISEAALSKASLNKQVLLLAILILAVISILAAVLYNLRKKLKLKNGELESKKIEITKANEQLNLELKRKSTLFKELNHRVKNNLTILSGLVYLQESSLGLKHKHSHYEALRNRIKSIALIHEKLYQQEEESNNIELEPYLRSLINEVHNALGHTKSIEITLKCHNISLPLDEAIPVAIILNELVTNSFKHAFENIEDPKINIYADMREDKILLRYADNGMGFSEEITNTESLGVKLIDLLVAQIKGKTQVQSSEKGYEFELVWLS